MELDETKDAYCLKMPSTEERLEQVRKQLEEVQKHCGRMERENDVLQGLYNRQYNVSQNYANMIKEYNERMDTMHYALYEIRNLFLSNDVKSRLTKSERKELVDILARTGIH